jgi:inorganic pyrophosphatase
VVEMMRFFEDYKVLEGKAVEVGDRITVEEAHQALRDSIQRYRERFGK